MTEFAQPKLGRGGKRVGAGRKPKGFKSSSMLTASEVEAAAVPMSSAEIEAVARAQAHAALNTLVQIALNDGNESVRVRAASLIVDRAYGKPCIEADTDGLPFLLSLVSEKQREALALAARAVAGIALRVLEKIMAGSPSAVARTAAASALLDRGYGSVGVAASMPFPKH